MSRCLAVRLDSLGDVLVTGPAIRALKARYDRLTLLCGPRGRAAAELLPGVDDVICWEAPWIDPEPAPVSESHVAALRDAVREAGVDVAVVFTSFHQSALPTALVLRLAGVPWIGAVSGDYPGSLLDLRLTPPEPMPEPQAQLRLASACGGALPHGDDGRLRVQLPPVELPEQIGSASYVVLHPGTSVPARAWPVERFREAARALVTSGMAVVVTGAPDEVELTGAVAADNPGVVDLGGRTDLAALAGVLDRADVVVVGNTGPAHLAAAVRTPIVSLFAPTVPATCWAPYGVPVELLGDQTAACAGSRATACPVAGHPCLSSVTPTDVVDAVLRLRTAARRPVEGVAS